MIYSPQNSKVKQVRRLLADRRYRAREGLFVMEGERWLGELLRAQRRPEYVLATSIWLSDPSRADELDRLESSVFEIDEGLLNDVAETESPPGVLAVVPIESLPLPTRLSFGLILDAVRDPGNLGAMMRTAAAAGVDVILITPGCVDVYNPKVVRASMGAHLRLPLQQASWSTVRHLCRDMNVWLAEADGSHLYNTVSWLEPSAIIIGNEAHGPGREARQLAGGSVRIPMHSDTESLNAAVAAGILLFEVARQRSLA